MKTVARAKFRAIISNVKQNMAGIIITNADE